MGKQMFDFQFLREKARRVARRRWMNKHLREISDNDNHLGLEHIYQHRDPWNLDSPLEHSRFAATNRLIEAQFGRVGDLLEIGSGEGLHSQYLQQLCERLWGVEVSATAVARARQRLPQANFHQGVLAQQPWLAEQRRFDLIVACEVLYYMSDPRATVELMSRLGRSCLVTFFTPEAPKLHAIVDSVPGVQKSWFHDQGVTWLMAWWHNEIDSGRR